MTKQRDLLQVIGDSITESGRFEIFFLARSAHPMD